MEPQHDLVQESSVQGQQTPDLAPLMQRGQISEEEQGVLDDTSCPLESQMNDSPCSTGFPEQSAALGSPEEQVSEENTFQNIYFSNNVKIDSNSLDSNCSNIVSNKDISLQLNSSNQAILSTESIFKKSDDSQKKICKLLETNSGKFTKKCIFKEGFDQISTINLNTTPVLSLSSPSSVIEQLPNESSLKMISYAKAVAPPGVQASTTGSSPDCGILLERLDGLSLDSYAWAITDIVGKASITYIGRDPRDNDYILVFLKTTSMAQTLVEGGVRLKGRWLNVSFFQQPAVRLTISGVLPFIPDCLIIDTLEEYGTSVYSVLRRIPAAVRMQAFKGASSYRREIYLVKKNPSINIPEKIQVTFLGCTYDLELSNTGPKCFKCGLSGHLVNKCSGVALAATEGQPQQQGTSGAIIPTATGDSLQLIQNGKVQSTSTTSSSTLGQATMDKGGHGANPSVNCRSYFTQCNLASLPRLEIQEIQIGKNKPKKTEPTQTSKDTWDESVILRKASGFVLNSSPGMIRNITTQVESLMGSIEIQTNGNSKQTQPMMNTNQPNPTQPNSQHDCNTKKKRQESQPHKSNQHQCDILYRNEEENDCMDVSDSPSFSLDEQKLHAEKQGNNPAEEKFIQVYNQIQRVKEPTFLFGKINKSNIPIPEKRESKRNDRKTNDVEDKELKIAVEVINDWCFKSCGLKAAPRKNLSAQFVKAHPLLEDYILRVLSIPGWCKPSSAKFRKIQDLLLDVKQLHASPKIKRNTKRKQLSPVTFKMD